MPDPTDLRRLLPFGATFYNELFLAATQVLARLGPSADETRAVEEIMKLDESTEPEASIAWRLVANLPPLFGTQSGASPTEAVAIHTQDGDLGIAAEYHWLFWKFGEEDEDYTLLGRGMTPEHGKPLDYFNLRLESGELRTVWFDISQFFDK